VSDEWQSMREARANARAAGISPLTNDELADAIKALVAPRYATPDVAAQVDDALAGWAHLTDPEFERVRQVHAAVVEVLTRMTPTDPFERAEVATAILDAIVEVMNQ
jgi:hypothetical protein